MSELRFDFTAGTVAELHTVNAQPTKGTIMSETQETFWGELERLRRIVASVSDLAGERDNDDALNEALGVLPTHPNDLPEHVFHVAVVVNGIDRYEAQRRLIHNILPHVAPTDYLESWWVAEDDREDGSDCDSAVFVHPGQQDTAQKLLNEHGLTTGGSAPTPDVHVVLKGDPIDGFSVHGPFLDPDVAIEWADSDGDRNWSVTQVARP